MVDEQLSAYVQNMLKEGYSRDTIKSHLLRYGYSASVVDAALRSPGSHKHTIAFVFVCLTVIAALTLFFILQLGEEVPEEAQLMVRIEPETETVRVGGVLSFTLTLESDKPASVTYGRVKYRVADSQGGVVASKEERVSLLQTTIRDSLNLPHSIKVGSYSLIAEVSVSGNDFMDSAPFEVAEDSPTFIGERSGPPSLEEGKRITEIVTLSEEDAPRAHGLCLEFANQQAVDQCLLESGLATNNELFCPDIRNADKRDTCYFNIMLILDKRELCSSITNQNLKSTCVEI